MNIWIKREKGRRDFQRGRGSGSRSGRKIRGRSRGGGWIRRGEVGKVWIGMRGTRLRSGDQILIIGKRRQGQGRGKRLKRFDRSGRISLRG